MGSKGLGRGLGTGLGAIFGDAAVNSKDFEYVPIARVEPRENQPRNKFGEEELQELADSIAEHGILQPLTVRSVGDGFYQIIAGERRWRAARLAGLRQVPVHIVTADDRRATELAMVENLQREGLNPVEEALGYKMLTEEYGLTQEEVAQRVSKSRPVVTNAMRLLTLPETALNAIKSGELSAGAGRALVALGDEALIASAAATVTAHKLNVRETEALVKRLLRERERQDEEQTPKKEIKVNYVAEVEQRLGHSLGRRVRVSGGKRKGKIEIEYYDHGDFERLCEALDSLSLEKENGQ